MLDVRARFAELIAFDQIEGCCRLGVAASGLRSVDAADRGIRILGLIRRRSVEHTSRCCRRSPAWRRQQRRQDSWLRSACLQAPCATAPVARRSAASHQGPARSRKGRWRRRPSSPVARLEWSAGAVPAIAFVIRQPDDAPSQWRHSTRPDPASRRPRRAFGFAQSRASGCRGPHGCFHSPTGLRRATALATSRSSAPGAAARAGRPPG